MSIKREYVATNAEYLAANGQECPFCHSNLVEAGHTSGDANVLWQEVKCLSCTANWQDNYTLTGFAYYGPDSEYIEAK